MTTTKKRKTASKPAHVKPLNSARWSGVTLSKGTQSAINQAYAKRRKKAKASKEPKPQGEGWVQVKTGTTKYDTGWVQVKTESYLTSEPQTIHQIANRIIDDLEKKVKHPFRDQDLAIRLAKSLNYLSKQGIVERTKKGAFEAFALITKARINKLTVRYAKAYELLYSTRDLSNVGIPDSKYRQMVKAGRELIDLKPDLYKAFVRANGDAATSDREVAAYMWAWSGKDIPKPSQIEPSKTTLDASGRREPRTLTSSKEAFVVGGVYKCRQMSTDGIPYLIEVVSRTPKRLTIRRTFGRVAYPLKQCNVQVSDGAEWIYPDGSGYSHAPIVNAKRDLVGSAAKPNYEGTKVIAKLPNLKT